jgi:mono/diheme cytochrome c family protein
MKKINTMSLPSQALDRLSVANMEVQAMFKFLVKPAIALVALLFSQALFAATCKYEIDNEWNSGFQATVSIINESSTPVNNWEASWAWDDGSSFVQGWNAVFDCTASACSVTGPSHAVDVAANQTVTFGFIGAKGADNTPAQASVTINGDACEPTTPPIDELSVLWTLDGTQSNIQYVSTKNDHNSEVITFSQGTDGSNALNGSISDSGEAILSIDLNDLETGIETRNERMRNFVFETELLPTAYVTVALDLASLSSMPIETSVIQTLSGNITIHGVSQNIEADVIIAKTSATSLLVSTLKPILVDSKNFDFASGIEVLRTLASLSSIGEVVPVYFSLTYVANTDVSVLPIAMATQPAGPTDLNAVYNQTTANSALNWQDNSNDESGFIVRRKTASGLWSTVANVLLNLSNHTESLTQVGEYDYKVIAVNGSIPSTPSNVARVVVTETDPDPDPDPDAGQIVYDQACASCHGPSGEGVGSFPAINVRRDLIEMSAYIAEFMPLGNPGACDQQCADDVSSYIETFWDGNNPDPGGTACLIDRPISDGARQLKILTRSEYQRSVEDLLGVNFNAADGLSEDDKIGLFANNTHTSIVSSSYSNFLVVAEEIAQWSAAQDFEPAISCNAMDQACVNTVIGELAPRIFRRPLNSEEVQTYTAMADGSLTQGDVKEGITMALESMLSAPQFLYRHELGEPNPSNAELDSDAFELTSYEMATFLAYTFTGSTPDQTLLNAASNGLLRTDSEILSQATRLAEAESAKDLMGDFVASWLGTDDLDVAAKDESVWPGFDALVPHMKNEIRENFTSVMLDSNETFSSFYDADFSHINQTLAEHYGISGVFGDQMRRVTTADRGGILANGGFMARWGEAVETSPIIRSVRVRRRILCQDELANPPAGTFAEREARLAELSEILQNPTTTNRLKNHLLTEGPPCSSCHLEYINPLGFGMEDFDTVGKLRFNDLNGNSIDATGQLFAPIDYNNTSEVEVFTGSKNLAQTVSTLSSAQSCLSEQMFRYITGVGHENIDVSNPEAPNLADQEREGYACEIENLTKEMMDASPRAMFERFSTLEAVRYRKAWSRN